MTDRARGGVGDEVKEFAPTLPKKIPNGPCFSKDGFLYIVEQNRVLEYPAAEFFYESPDVVAGAVVPEGELIPKSEESYNHTARVCRVGPDNKLYIQLGQPYNVPAKEKVDLYRKVGIGGIIRMDRDGKNREVYATGLRNPVGMDFNPKDKTLWTNDNQVDGMGDDIPPGEMNRIAKQRAGFRLPVVRRRPYPHQRVQERYAAGRRRLPRSRAGRACGRPRPRSFYTGNMFPAKYQGAIFSTQHGSWNRTVPVGARVMVTFLKEDGHVAGKSEPFAEGWNDNGYYLGRPVDVAQLARRLAARLRRSRRRALSHLVRRQVTLLIVEDGPRHGAITFPSSRASRGFRMMSAFSRAARAGRLACSRRLGLLAGGRQRRPCRRRQGRRAPRR